MYNHRSKDTQTWNSDMKILTLQTIENTLNVQLEDLERQLHEAVLWEDTLHVALITIKIETVALSLFLLQDLAHTTAVIEDEEENEFN